MDTELIKRIDEEIDKAREAIAKDTINLVRINSEQGEPAPGAPFGTGPKEVLDTVLKMGEAEGFYTKDYGVGVVSLSLKEGQPDLGIWLHGDVVPAGDGWIYPPYEGVRYKDTHIIGRGATDNKGQLSAIFNILKIFKKLGIELNYNVGLYVGSNEETGMEDVKAFMQKCTPPKMSLVPDSGFPVGYGGKGSIGITFRSKKPLHGLNLAAGLPSSPGKATAELNGKFYETESPPRHGANPDPNGNMITKMMNKLLDEGLAAKEDTKTLEFLKDISLDVYGEKFGISVIPEGMPRLTMNTKKLTTEDGFPTLLMDIRFPVGITAEEIVERLTAAADDYGMEIIKIGNVKAPYLMDKNAPMVQLLAKIAKDVTGDPKEPYTLGGGTYAHRLPNAYVYGMDGNGRPADFPAGHGGAHGKDEMVSLDRLQRAMRIYARAMLALNETQW